MHARNRALFALIFTVILSNLLTIWLSQVTWLGLTATAGTWVAGFGFVARDHLQRLAPPSWVAAAILGGAVLSWFAALFTDGAHLPPGVTPATIAAASAAAFLVSELADWGVYSRLRRRHELAGQLVSNTVGAVVDTLVFLQLSGFGLGGTVTQVLVKVGATSVVVLAARAAITARRTPATA